MLEHIVYNKKLVEQNENFIFVFFCLLFKYIKRKKTSFFSFTDLHRKDEIKHLLQHHFVLPTVDRRTVVVLEDSFQEVVDSSLVVEDSLEEVVDSSMVVEDSLEEVADSLKEVVDSLTMVEDSLKEAVDSSTMVEDSLEEVADNFLEVDDSLVEAVDSSSGKMITVVNFDEEYDSMQIERHLVFKKKKIAVRQLNYVDNYH
jgi:methyl-accepting chemotaxis protein